MEENNINGVLPMGVSTVFITNLCGRKQHQTRRPLGNLPHVVFTSLYGEKHQLGMAHEKFPYIFLMDVYGENQL